MTVVDAGDVAALDGSASVASSADKLTELEQAVQDVVFGSVAGVVGKVVEYPFDTVKVRLQSQPEGKPIYTGPLDCFRQSIKHDGVLRGLYRGVSAPCVGAAIETSSLFFSYRLAQKALLSTPMYDSSRPLPLSGLCISGAASGAFTSLLLTPIELVKCKIQVPQGASVALRPGIFSVIAEIFRNQGMLGFWRGQLGTLIRETGGSAAWFGSFEGVSAFFRARQRQSSVTEREPSDMAPASLPIYQQLLAGAAAGMSYNFLFYPADTIKSRMQTEEAHGGSFMQTGHRLWRDQGLKGMYRGCGITVARSAPSSALIFTIYEGLKGAFG